MDEIDRDRILEAAESLVEWRRKPQEDWDAAAKMKERGENVVGIAKKLGKTQYWVEHALAQHKRELARPEWAKGLSVRAERLINTTNAPNAIAIGALPPGSIYPYPRSVIRRLKGCGRKTALEIEAWFKSYGIDLPD